MKDDKKISEIFYLNFNKFFIILLKPHTGTS